MNIKFISYLEVFQIIKILCSKRIFDEIYYLDISKIGKMLLNFFSINRHLKHFTFFLGEVRDQTGARRSIKIYQEDLSSVCNGIEKNLLEKSPFITAFGEKFNRRKVSLFFKKRLGFEIKEVVVFINVIDWYLNKSGGNSKSSVEVSIEHTLCFEVLKDFASKEYDITLNSYISLRNVFKLAYSLFGNLYLSVIAIVSPIFYSKKYSHGPLRNGKSNSTPVLATKYQPYSLTFDLTSRSDIFWLLKSKIPHDQVLIYFGRTDIPATDVMGSVLRKNGVKSIAMSKGATNTSKISVYRPSILLAEMLSRLTGSIILKIFKEISNFRLESLVYFVGALYFVREYSKAYDFYKCMGIKVNVSSADTVIDDIPRWVALKALGGVSVSYQKSCLEDVDVLLASTTDVYFQFGPYYFPLTQRAGWDNYSTISCGYITDYSFVAVKERSKALRKRIMAKGAKFIVCYFDQGSGDDRLRFISNRKSAYVYERLLRWVIADENIGLLCSPKRPVTLSARISNCVALMEKAKATGRFILMDGDYSSSNYATEAAQASDIVIALLVGGTAGLESSLSGQRTIFLDLEGSYSYPEYRRGRNVIVFDSLDNMINAIERYRWNPESFDELGNIDMMHMIKEKEPFRDGKAAERIGQYLYWLLDSFGKGETREGAMKYANQNYAEMWGAKKMQICR